MEKKNIVDMFSTIKKFEVKKSYLIALALLCVWLYYYYPIYPVDLKFDDENQYLASGMHNFYFNSFFYVPANSPVYIKWYKLLYLIIGNGAITYIVNFLILPVFAALLISLILIEFGVNRLATIIVFFICLFSDFFFTMWPMIGMFNFCIVAIVLLLHKKLKPSTLSFILGSSIILIATYVRPENVLTLILYNFLFFFYFIKAKIVKQPLRLLVVNIAMACIVFYIFGFPLSGGRGYIAFSQHYALTYTAQFDSSLNPWRDYAIISKKVFGNSNSLIEAARYSPSAFLKHIFFNIKTFFGQGFSMVIGIILPQKLLDIVGIKQHITVYRLAIIALFYFSFFKISFNKLKLISFVKGNISFIIVVISFTVTGLFICIIFFPRNHYLISFIPILLLLFVLLLKEISVVRNLKVLRVFASLFFVLLLVIQFNIKAVANTSDRPYYDFSQSFHNPEKLNILENDGWWDAFISNSKTYPIDDYLNNSFSDVVEQKKINLIILNPALKIPFFIVNGHSDSSLYKLVNNAEAIGFHKNSFKGQIVYYTKN